MKSCIKKEPFSLNNFCQSIVSRNGWPLNKNTIHWPKGWARSNNKTHWFCNKSKKTFNKIRNSKTKPSTNKPVECGNIDTNNSLNNMNHFRTTTPNSRAVRWLTTIWMKMKECQWWIRNMGDLKPSTITLFSNCRTAKAPWKLGRSIRNFWSILSNFRPTLNNFKPTTTTLFEWRPASITPKLFPSNKLPRK